MGLGNLSGGELLLLLVIALLAGLGLLEFLPEAAFLSFIVAAIFIILGIMLFFQCSDPGIVLKTIGVCA